MFGFVKVYKPELRVKEFEMYKAVYCSLCKKLGKDYGILTRFTLSYDFTFLALLSLSMSDADCAVKSGRCVFNPLKKCSFCENCQDDFSLPAAVSVITLYYKILDNVADEKGIKRLSYRLLSFFYKRAHKKAAEGYPEIENIVREYISRQGELERENCADLDRITAPTAEALSEILSRFGNSENDRRALARLGYCIGKYIYFADALTDCEDDKKHGRYNPLLLLEQGEDRARRNIYMCINEAINAFELIEFRKFKNILGNIIYMGLENSVKPLKDTKEQTK